jgi:hypothetical protein
MSPMKQIVYDEMFKSLIDAGHGENAVKDFLVKHFDKMYERAKWLYCEENDLSYDPEVYFLSSEEMEEREDEDYCEWTEMCKLDKLMSNTAKMAL